MGRHEGMPSLTAFCRLADKIQSEGQSVILDFAFVDACLSVISLLIMRDEGGLDRAAEAHSSKAVVLSRLLGASERATSCSDEDAQRAGETRVTIRFACIADDSCGLCSRNASDSRILRKIVIFVGPGSLDYSFGSQQPVFGDIQSHLFGTNPR